LWWYWLQSMFRMTCTCMARPVPLGGQRRGRGGVATGTCGEVRREGKHRHDVTQSYPSQG